MLHNTSEDFFCPLQVLKKFMSWTVLRDVLKRESKHSEGLLIDLKTSDELWFVGLSDVAVKEGVF